MQIHSKRILEVVTYSQHAHVHVLPLAKALSNKDYSVDFATLDDGFSELIRKEGFKTYDIPFVRNLRFFKDLRCFLSLYALIRKNRYSVVHTHCSKAGFIGRCAAFIAGVPNIVHTVHGFSFHDYLNPLKSFLYKKLETLCSRLSSRIISVNVQDYKIALDENICDKEKIVTILNGVDTNKFKNNSEKKKALRRELSLNDEVVTFGTVGFISEQKNPFYYIEVVKILSKSLGHPFKFYWIGEGPLESELINKIKENKLTEYFKVIEYKSNIFDYYNLFDYFLLLSKWEGLPMVLLEAMATKVPVIASNIKGNNEVINQNENGLLVELQTPENVANALVKLFNDRDKKHKLVDNAYNDILIRFNQKKMFDKTVEILINA